MKMKKNKALWALMSVVIAASMLLVACGGTSDAPTGSVAPAAIQSPSGGTPTPEQILKNAGLSPVSEENIDGGGIFYALVPAMTWDMAKNTTFAYSVGEGVSAVEITTGLTSLSKFGLVGLTAADLGFVIYIQSKLPAVTAETAAMQLQAIAAPMAPMNTFANMQRYLPAETFASVTFLETAMGPMERPLMTTQLAEFDIAWLAASMQKTISLGFATLTISASNASNCKMNLTLDFKGEKFSVDEDLPKGCDPAVQFFYGLAKLIEKFARRTGEILLTSKFIETLNGASGQPAQIEALQFKAQVADTIFAMQSMVGTLLRQMITSGYFTR